MRLRRTWSTPHVLPAEVQATKFNERLKREVPLAIGTPGEHLSAYLCMKQPMLGGQGFGCGGWARARLSQKKRERVGYQRIHTSFKYTHTPR